jgi:hypothetical protein
MTVQQVTKLLFRIRDSSTFSSFIVFDWKQWITKSHITLFPNVDKSFGKIFCSENALVVLEINSILNLINMNSHVLKTATVKSSSYKLKFCPDKDLLKIFLFHLNSTASFEKLLRKEYNALFVS